jgi:hypothetical protein
MRHLKAIRRDVEYMPDHAKEVLTLTWIYPSARTEQLQILGGGATCISVASFIEKEERIEYPSSETVKYYTDILFNDEAVI